MERLIIYRLIKNRYHFIFFIFVIFSIQACLNTQEHLSKSTRIQHIVICWLKEPGSLKDRQHLIDASKRLSEIPGVIDLSVGSVLPSTRAIVDSSFDVALIVSFSRLTALKEYLAHPIHLKLIKETVQPLTRKVLVYDFMDE